MLVDGRRSAGGATIWTTDAPVSDLSYVRGMGESDGRGWGPKDERRALVRDLTHTGMEPRHIAALLNIRLDEVQDLQRPPR